MPDEKKLDAMIKVFGKFSTLKRWRPNSRERERAQWMANKIQEMIKGISVKEEWGVTKMGFTS